MKYMLDTNVLVTLLRLKHLDQLKAQFSKHHSQFCISTITVDELHMGILLTPSKFRAAKQRDLENLLQVTPIADFDKAAAEHSAEIRHHLRKVGNNIGVYDNLIAGHARSLGLKVVTSNTREFERVPGLLVEDWLR